MTPILYASTETGFTTNGLGRLTDIIECLVTEERNGGYECEFKYPISGIHYADIDEGCFIACTHDDDGDLQPFRIYRRSAPLNGIVTFNARHLSYDLSHVILNPFTADSVQDTLSGIGSNSINTNPFTFSSDKTTLAPFALETPASVRSIMGGVEGSILDIYGGEWEFDKYNVYLRANRGANSGVTIRYGKNLLDLNQTRDVGGIYNSIVPFWRQEVDGVDTLITLPEHMVTAAGVTNPVPVVMDFTMEFQEQPTENELRTFAENYLTVNEPWVPPETLTVDFVALWQTLDYKDVANLLKLRLCDTVAVYYPALGVTAHDIKVIKTVYDVLADRYYKIELGKPQATFAQVLTNNIDKSIKDAQAADRGFFDAAITTATDLLTGANGGHVVIKRDANGEPQEILILDTDSELTATNILRINLNGIGFSTNGGVSYDTAWTIDGQFVADFITSGTLKAIMIEGPTADTYWNLASGRFQNYDESQVVAQVETSSGVHTPVTYDVKHTLCIDDGLMELVGEVDSSGEDIELFALGLKGEGMDYTYYGAAEVGEDKSYPYTGLNLSGSRINGRAGTEVDKSTSIPVTYIPKAVMTPDFIELGEASGMQDSNGDPATGYPNRNKLHLGAGWTNYKDSIYLRQYYTVGTWYSGGVYHKNRYLNNKRRVAWEINPRDTISYEAWYGVGYFITSRKEICLTLPVGRPINKSAITRVTGEGYIRRIWQNGNTLLNTEVQFHLDSDYEQQVSGRVYYWDENGITIGIRKDDGSAWANSGTDHAPVCIQLIGLGIEFV